MNRPSDRDEPTPVRVEQVLTEAWCEWFLNCPRTATDTRWHPIIGDVPVCATCARAVDGPAGAA